ncbi:MAG: hypothetical protein H6622_00775 [Halobacteriovoraceae bacterium]|nr:hypothetical protein [Halobacteriovoraceae bacterium]
MKILSVLCLAVIILNNAYADSSHASRPYRMMAEAELVGNADLQEDLSKDLLEKNEEVRDIAVYDDGDGYYAEEIAKSLVRLE